MLLENNVLSGEKHNGSMDAPAGLAEDGKKSPPLESDASTIFGSMASVRYLFESIGTGIWAIDSDNNTAFLNGKMADLLKYTVEEISGRNIFEFVYEEDLEKVKKFWQSVREGERLQQEIMLRCKDGTPCYAIVSAIAARDDQGCFMYSLGMFTDITERKRMHDAIRNSQEKYRILIEDMNDVIWETDKDYVYTYVNPMMFDMLGYTPDETVGKTVFDIIPPEEAGRAKQLFSILEANKIPTFKVESEYRHKDGQIVYIEISGRSIKDGNGVFIGCIGTARNITKWRKAEEALIKSEEKYRLLTENIDDLIWETDKEGVFTYMSPRSIDLFGQRPEYAIGKTPFDLMMPDDVDKVKKLIMAEKKKKNLLFNVAARYLHRDGYPLYVELSGRPIIDDNGVFQGYRGITRDVTERKNAEIALEAAKSEAELYVDLMGHDINNMNQITMGFLELVHAKMESEGKLDKVDNDLLEKAMSSLKNSSLLIDNVRKLQREKMGLYKPEVLDIARLVKEVVPQYEHIPGRDVKINVATTDHCYVKANELLKDVFINLIGNSIKHSKGSLEVNIGVYNVVRDGRQYCKVMVEDNGPGIPDTLKATLFDRLNLVNTRARGKGFGLCLIKMLVDDYNGIFYVENRVQGDHMKGSRFVVMIPSAIID